MKTESISLGFFYKLPVSVSNFKPRDPLIKMVFLSCGFYQKIGFSILIRIRKKYEFLAGIITSRINRSDRKAFIAQDETTFNASLDVHLFASFTQFKHISQYNQLVS